MDATKPIRENLASECELVDHVFETWNRLGKGGEDRLEAVFTVFRELIEHHVLEEPMGTCRSPQTMSGGRSAARHV